MLKTFARLIIRLRIPIIILVLAITLMFAFFSKNVRISSNLIDLAPEDNEEFLALQRTLQRFGSSTFVMISVQSDDAYSLSTLTKIKNISEQIQRLPEVDEVIDPLNATVFKYLFGMIVIKESFPGNEIPESREKIEQHKQEMLSEPILKNVVVSENGESLAIYIRLSDDYNTQDIKKRLFDIVEPYRGPEEFYIHGRPIIESWVSEYVSRDAIRLAVPIVLLVIIVLFINFRSIRGIVLPLAIMIGSIIWTLGLMGIFGKQITIVGVMLPTLILVISSSYSIHFLNQYYKDVKSDLQRKEDVERSINNIGKTIILAALTTIAGFAALTINKIKPMFELGIFVLIGVFFSMCLSLTFLPSILSILRKPRKEFHAWRRGSKINVMFTKLGHFILGKWRIILLLALCVGIWSLVGIRNIVVDTSWKRFFKKNSPILVNERYIRSNFGGVSTININFETLDDSELNFKSLSTLRYVDQVEQWIRDRNLFGATTSFVGYIKRANQLINNNNPDYYKLPDNDAELLKILLMFKMTELTKSLSNVITQDFKNASIVVRETRVNAKDPTVVELREFKREFKEYINNNPFNGITVNSSGVDLIYVSLVDYTVRSQLMSIAISILIVFIIISITFKSFVHGLFGLIPIIFGLLLNFGAMSYFRIPLDFITAMIASIAVGLGVDNSIHYLIRFARTRHSLPLTERIRGALINSGIPIFFTSFTLIAGFCVLLFSSFKPILYFGLLISVTMIGCFIGVIFVLPASLHFFKPKKIIEGRIE
ncbi:MAG: RND family transporter [Spirochaetota bacterium]|nr:MAG: RND family transporter [Spirochaetota bacterium]